MKIRITQDTEAKATYIYLQEEATHSHTVEMPNGWNMDIDVDGNLIGIEVLELLRSILIEDITDADPPTLEVASVVNEGMKQP